MLILVNGTGEIDTSNWQGSGRALKAKGLTQALMTFIANFRYHAHIHKIIASMKSFGMSLSSFAFFTNMKVKLKLLI